MACPYFMPTAKLENGSWPHPARLPLGAGWTGHCTAPGHNAEIPSQDIVTAFCNLGYADGCSWSPQPRLFDAVRFAVQAPARKNSRTIQLRYSCERNHRPLEVGLLQFDPTQNRWLRMHGDRCIQKMAECFLEAHSKRVSRTDPSGEQGKEAR